jgi:hypothetical protein
MNWVTPRRVVLARVPGRLQVAEDLFVHLAQQVAVLGVVEVDLLVDFVDHLPQQRAGLHVLVDILEHGADDESTLTGRCHLAAVLSALRMMSWMVLIVVEIVMGQLAVGTGQLAVGRGQEGLGSALMMFQFCDDFADLVGLVRGFLDQVVEHCQRPVRIAGAPETGRGADPAPARQVGVPRLVVIACQDQLQMRCSKEMPAGIRLPVAHFGQHSPLHFA